jgi:hypothetical protein
MRHSSWPLTILLAAVAVGSGWGDANTKKSKAVADQKTAATLDAARDYIHDQDWAKATHLLQRVLDLQEDRLVPLRINVEITEVTILVSARKRADWLVGQLPPKGMAFYRATYGPRAAADLEEGKDDRKLLEEILRRYGYTDAGWEAKKRLRE